jgi:hypothetical protein
VRRRSPSGGGYDFAIDPAQGADRVEVFWLPRLDPAVVLLTPAPQGFSTAANLVGLTPADEQLANDGAYVLFRGATGRLTGVMLVGATQETLLAAVIPLDQHFSARSASALRLWRMLSEAPPHRWPDPLTRQRRQRLSLALRALDGRLAKATYRELGQVLFGSLRISAGASWKTNELRDRTIRLVRTGLDLMRGGYLALLRMTTRRRR